MPGNSDGTKYTVTYPTTEQRERWDHQMDEMGYSSLSQFIKDMTEAGMKKFDVSVEPDETRLELREQRNELSDELERTRSRINDLEDQLYDGEYTAVREYVEDHPGAAFEDILQHIVDSAPPRVNRHIEDLVADDVLSERTDSYYLVGDSVERET